MNTQIKIEEIYSSLRKTKELEHIDDDMLQAICKGLQRTNLMYDSVDDYLDFILSDGEFENIQFWRGGENTVQIMKQEYESEEEFNKHVLYRDEEFLVLIHNPEYKSINT